MSHSRIETILLIILLLVACGKRQEVKKDSTISKNGPAIVRTILREPDNFYYVNFGNYPKMDMKLPIGVFDSGTGGLTVLDAVLQYDEHNNQALTTGQDGIPDFNSETFVYLADQANMPYGNYSSVGKTDLLVEHIMKDAQFMLSNKYYAHADADSFETDKSPVKTLVIACNTATAYGKELIDEFIAKTGIELHVIGVIDAGARGALQGLAKDENAAIGVMATVGTIASKGYENTLLSLKEVLGYSGKIQVYNHGGHGIAEAVDEEPDFIDREATAPKEAYRGPSLNSLEHPIDKALMERYNFDFDHNKMLCDTKEVDDCQVLQLNDPENYVRYHLVSLMEKIRKSSNTQPLKAIVLGCTHYPYLTEEIKIVLDELYNYRKDGQYFYRDLMVEDVKIIDPAVHVAKELYGYLKKKELFNPSGDIRDSRFFISVPNKENANVLTDENGRFPYDYKYGRVAGEIQEYVKVVPFSESNISEETVKRLSNTIPTTFGLIPAFAPKEVE